MIEGVVKVVKAGLNEQLTDVVAVIGTTTRLGILEYLGKNGPSQAGIIATDLAISRTTVAAALLALEELGAIVTDSPADQRHGKRVMYAVNKPRIDELLKALNGALRFT